MASPCSLCTAHCCKTYLITVTIFDVVRIAEKSGKQTAQFACFSPARLLNTDNDTMLEFHDKGVALDYLLALKSHPCTFLGEDNRCTIHEYAPLGCRMYPHMNDGGKLIPRPLCPLPAKLVFMAKKPSIKAEIYLDYLKAYKEIVAKWNRTRGKEGDCMDFLVKESKNYNIAQI